MKGVMKTTPIHSLCAVIFTTLACSAIAAPPPNDNFADRTLIPLDVSPPPAPPPTHAQASAEGSNVDATKEPGERDHAGYPGGKSVWWTFTTPANGSIRVSTYGSSFSTVLAVYTGNDLTNLNVVAESKANNWDDDLSSQVEFTAYAGTTYQVAVDGDGSPAQSGNIILSITLQPPTPPSFYRQPQHQYALPGKTVYLSVVAIGTQPLSYQWRRDGAPIVGSTNANHTFVLQGAGDYGVYDVVITNLGGSATSTRVAVEPATGSAVSVFNDARYVSTWISETGNAFLEQESLWHLGHPVVAFTNITGTLTNGIVVFPSLTIGALGPDLTSEERGALSNFVARGGILIVHGDYDYATGDGSAAGLLNAVFGWSLVEGYVGGNFTLTAACTGTVFATSPVELGLNFATSVLVEQSLPADALSIYSGAAYRLGNLVGPGTDVALLPHRTGAVVYLGWDWSDALPFGARDGGWLDVLERATRATDPPPPVPAPRITNPGYQDWGSFAIFQFSFQGYFGKSYSVEGSTNLVDWENLGSPAELSPGQFVFQDLGAKSRPGRFYRVNQQ